MNMELLAQLEQKVAHAVEIIELLRLQVEELEQENAMLSGELEKWRRSLSTMIKRLDQIDPATQPARQVKTQVTQLEEEFMTV